MTLEKRNKPYPHWLYTHTSTGDSLRIVPERGGLIAGWTCNGQEMLYFDQDRFSNPQKSVRGGIPVLFPICGSLPDDLLPLSTGKFVMKQHGFARDLPWQISELEDQTGILLSLKDTPETKSIFPFSFLLEMTVQTTFQALNINININNKSNFSMPYSFGLHPYFRVQSLAKTSFKGMPENCFDHIHMIDSKTSDHLSQLSKGVDLLINPVDTFPSLLDDEAGSCLKLVHHAPMDLVVVWTDPPRPMVCFEVWTSPRNSMITGERRFVLTPGETQKLCCRYEFSKTN